LIEKETQFFYKIDSIHCFEIHDSIVDIYPPLWIHFYINSTSPKSISRVAGLSRRLVTGLKYKL
jgi:hypothetical protein